MVGRILLVLVIMDLILLWLWLLRVSTELKRSRDDIALSWAQLREALFLRREIMPYLVASISFNEPAVVESIGNACDLASNSVSIGDQGHAEQRLGAALKRLLAIVAQHPEVMNDPSFQRLTRELQMLDKRIEFLAGIYNKQVEAYNVKLVGASAKVLGLFVALARAEQFPVVVMDERPAEPATGE